VLPRICVVAMYVGELPSYFSFFIASCYKNKSIDFIVFNDTFKSSIKKENVSLINFSLSDFNDLASKKLDLKIELINGWKINELKPTFGIVFEEQLKGYDFWAWSDIDIIWGDLRAFLTPELLNRVDVFAPKEKWTAGHFTLFRNTGFVNRLYTHSPSCKTIFLSQKYTAFEESCHRWEGEFFNIDDLEKQGELVSMYDVVRNLERENKIRCLFKDVIREFPQPIDYQHVNGKWIDNRNNEEFMYYHLLTVKKIWRFYIPLLKNKASDLMATPFGLVTRHQHDNFLLSIGWWAKRALHCAVGIFLTLKKEGTSAVMRRKLQWRENKKELIR